MSFRLKTILGIAFIEVILLSFLVGSTLIFLQDFSKEELYKKSTTIATIFATTAKNAVLATDLASLETMVDEVMKNPGMVYVRVLGNDRVLAERGDAEKLKKPFKADVDFNTIDDGIMDAFSEVIEAEMVFGRVELGISTATNQKAFEEAGFRAISIAGLEVVISGLFSWFLGSFLTVQLRGLEKASDELNKGNLGYEIKVQGNDELARAAKAFNKMSTSLDESKKLREKLDEERATLEKQLFQSQKMEALGALAGGVSHDFNNILSSILGSVELAKMELEEDHPVLKDLLRIERSGLRAVNLVRQILTFSRQGTEELTEVDLSMVTSDTLDMLTASTPKNIKFTTEVIESCYIMGDATQMHQIVLNLCTNASHAIGRERPGSINVTLEILAKKTETEQEMLKLRVEDDGGGISEENILKIFDPFFTTKEVGKGTGLGLSVVHGIIEKHKGKVHVESEMGKGTTFIINFPTIQPSENTENSAA